RALSWWWGPSRLATPLQTPNAVKCEHGRQTAGANVRRREGNNPDHQLRSPSTVKWETRWEGSDSQDVGLEAAIIQRKRNSSLVESSCAEDVTGLKLGTEARDSGIRVQVSGIRLAA